MDYDNYDKDNESVDDDDDDDDDDDKLARWVDAYAGCCPPRNMCFLLAPHNTAIHSVHRRRSYSIFAV